MVAGSGRVGEGIVFVIVGFAFAAIALVMAGRAWAKVRLARDSVGWPTVDGVILGSSVVHDMVGSGRHQRRMYVPSVQYAYEVRGERFVSDVVAVSRVEHRDYAPIQALMRPFSQGAEVSVHVDPTNPQRVTLLTGARTHQWRALWGWVAYAALGFAMVAFGFTDL